MSDDHKPNRADETKRINELGGKVTRKNIFTINPINGLMEPSGISRVEGILAVSRAIGDIRLHPYVTCEPEFKEKEIKYGEDLFMVLGMCIE